MVRRKSAKKTKSRGHGRVKKSVHKSRASIKKSRASIKKSRASIKKSRASIKKSRASIKKIKKSVKKEIAVNYNAAVMLYSTVRNNNAYTIKYYLGAGQVVKVASNWLESKNQYNAIRRDGPQYDATDIQGIKGWFGALSRTLRAVKQFKVAHVQDNVFNFSFVCSVKKQAEVVDVLTDYIFQVKTPVEAQDGQAYNVKVTPVATIPRVFAHQYTVVFGVGFKSHNNNNNSSNPTSPELDLYVSTHANSIKDLPAHMFNYETSPVEYVGGLGRLFRFILKTNLSPKEVAHELKKLEPIGDMYYPTKDGKGELGYLTINLVAINGKEY
jgi:hypothetical protein